MASPPFNIAETIPGDSDFASQFPGVERTYRDVVESWLLVNHNNLGQHKFIELPWTDPATITAGASLSVLFADQTGHLKFKTAATEEYVGNPPGAIVYWGSTILLDGYLWPNGQAVSRTTFAALFARIGTVFGSGDGSTTFNLPDLRGRYIAVLDNLGGVATANRLVAAGFASTTTGGSGGLPTQTLLTVNLPPFTPGTVTTQGTGQISVGGNPPVGTNVHYATVSGGSTSDGWVLISTFSGSIGGSSTPFNTVPPTLMLNAMIKY